MKTGFRKIQGLTAIAALLLFSRCGPTTVVARLVTPVAEGPQPTATVTPRLERPRAAPPTATATSTPLPTATPTPRPAPRQVLPAPSAPAATPTAAPSAMPSPTRTVVRATPTSTPVLAPVAATPSPTPSAAPMPAPPAPLATAPSPSSLETPSAAAALPGEWEFRADAGRGIITGTLKFRSTSSGLAGVYIGLHGNATELSNLHAAGSGVSFDLVTPTAVWHLDGTVSGDSIDGTFRTAERSIRWTAQRKPAPPLLPTPSHRRDMSDLTYDPRLDPGLFLERLPRGRARMR